MYLREYVRSRLKDLITLCCFQRVTGNLVIFLTEARVQLEKRLLPWRNHPIYIKLEMPLIKKQD
jgi:hypothetical protein